MFLDTKPYRLALFVALFYLVTSPPPQIFNVSYSYYKVQKDTLLQCSKNSLFFTFFCDNHFSDSHFSPEKDKDILPHIEDITTMSELTMRLWNITRKNVFEHSRTQSWKYVLKNVWFYQSWKKVHRTVFQKRMLLTWMKYSSSIS